MCIRDSSRIGKGCRIGPGTHLRDVSIDDRCTVRNSVAEESVIQKGANIGPFAYLRPGTVIGEGVKIGNFVAVSYTHLDVYKRQGGWDCYP